MKIMIACDSFKGSLESKEVNKACQNGILDACPDIVTDSIVLADGGEGTVDAVAEGIPGGTFRSVSVENPLGDYIQTRYYILPDGETAIIETASAAGLSLIPPKERNPLVTSTYGLGQIINDALDHGCRHIMIGLGGSATNDGGTGMLQALGCRFFDTMGKEIKDRGGRILGRIAGLDSSAVKRRLEGVSVTALCDVKNPLTGEYGATYIFGPQKGADAHTLGTLEAGMINYARIIGEETASLPGAGAAGGLGAALMALMGAEMKSGIDTILDLTQFDRRISDCNMIITGEGRIDKSTLMGKAPYGILQRATVVGIPVIALGGSVDKNVDFSSFDAVLEVTPYNMPLEEAMQPETALLNIRKSVCYFLSSRIHK